MEIRVRFAAGIPVTEIQTHTSHVFLAGDEVLKVKKPVLFSFLDYSTPEKRRECCEKEVALNRRFSPDVYLGVVPLVAGEGGVLEPGEAADAVEWAVRMRRLPAGSSLSELLAGGGEVTAPDLRALADLLAAFYAREETTEEIAEFGSLESVRFNSEENFETTLDFGEELLPDATRRALREANRRFLDSRADLFAERVRQGRILDGHGDLKPENIFLTPAPVVTDCIEFNERFRYGDVLADLAYLTMGLLAAGREDLRAAFLDRFRDAFEPDFPGDLLAYYETYRAVVKGKIEGYRARQPEVPEAEREEARRIARSHFLLAERIAVSV